MRRAGLVGLAAVTAALEAHPPAEPLQFREATPIGIPLDVECQVNMLAYNWSLKAMPERAPLVESFDSLRLQRCATRPQGKSGKPAPKPPAMPSSAPVFYVDAVNGSDSAPGSEAAPFRTLHRAVAATRTATAGLPKPAPARVVLRGGVHSIGAVPLTLTSADSGLSIEAYHGEEPVLSAGVTLSGLQWQQVQQGFTQPVVGISNVAGAVSSGNTTAYGAGLTYMGKTDDAAGCAAACGKQGIACTSYTWHDSTLGDLAKQCFTHSDGVWQPVATKGATSGQRLNIWKASTKGRNLKPFGQLWGGKDALHRRKTRARFPSSNPELRGLWIVPFTGMVPSAQQWLAPTPAAAPAEIHIASPVPSGTHFDAWYIGLGGTLDGRFNPPRSYWGVAKPVGGGGSTYIVPSGMSAKPETFTDKNWTSTAGAILHAYQGPHWGDWAFEVDGFDAATRTLKLGRGGFQEARGSRNGGEWYIENILAELDSPNEWYYDEAAEELYFYPNSTGAPSGDDMVVGQHDTLIRVMGSRRDPVTDVSVTGITFAHTDATFMKDFFVPSSGDFAVHRGGALTVEGVERFTAQGCTFQSPGGSGVCIGGYARNVTISDSEIAWAGESGVLVVGDTALIDGTLGDHPKDVMLQRLLIREVGVYVQQSAAVFIAQSERVTIDRLVAFNGPRQGTVWNDGMFGGHAITNSAIYMMVRSTGDCGPTYAWMRTQVLHRRDDGSFTLDGDYCKFEGNVLLTNYHGVWPIDLDDGSNRVNATRNVLAWGGFKNYLGNRKSATGNAYIYPDAVRSAPPPTGKLDGFFIKPFCANSDGQSLHQSGWGETWADNACFIKSTDVYEYGSCTTSQVKQLVPLSKNNSFYVTDGAPVFKCGSSSMSLSQWQGLGEDVGSTAHGAVSATEMVSIAKRFLP
eukprot:TRINITY_DN527_c0_g1_i1.p1 TRINITY_DN527_c0_g1~~TRINITY_DN527_c0_g1_i1.p1  ORF type:complete len:911 (+),score=322.25 TRINITY_DN527_c0_g1_i1:58-2790(+)